MEKEIIKALGAFESVRNYDDKPNQFKITFENGTIFQSYDSIIVIKFDYFESISLAEYSFKTYFGSDWDFSRTTSKYRNMFLNKDTKWCKDKVAKGEILVLDI